MALYDSIHFETNDEKMKKKRNAMRRAVKKDRNDLFTDEEKELWKTQTNTIIEESRKCVSMDSTLDLLESGFQRSRAVYGTTASSHILLPIMFNKDLGEEAESTLALRAEIARVYFDDGKLRRYVRILEQESLTVVLYLQEIGTVPLLS